MEVLTTSPSMAEQVSAQPEFGPQMPLSEKLLAIAIRAQNFTGASGVAVAIKEGQEIVCRASWGTSAPDVGVRLQDQNSFTYQCLRAGKPMRCDDAFSDPRVDNAACRTLGIRSIAAAPVTSGDVLGVIAAFAEDPNTFTETHLVVLTTLGEVVGKFLKDSEPLVTRKKDDLLSIEDELPDSPVMHAAAEPPQPISVEPPKPVETPKPAPVRVSEAAKPVEPPKPAPVKTAPPPTLPSQQAPAKTPFSAPAPAASANKPGLELEREPAIRPDAMMSSSEIRRDPSLVNSDAPVPPVPVTAKPTSKLSSLGDKRPAWLGIIDNAAKNKDAVVEPLAAEPTVPSNLREFPAVNPPLQSKVVPISPPVRNDEISLTFTEPAEPVMVDRRKYITLGGAAAVLVLVLGLWTWHSHHSSQSVPQLPPTPVQQQVPENDPSFQTPPPPVDQTQTTAPASAPAPTRTDMPTAQKPSARNTGDHSSATVEDTVTLVDPLIRTPSEVTKPAPEPEAPPSVTVTSASLPPDLLAVKTALPKGPAPLTSHFVPSEVMQKVTPVYPEVAKRYHMQGKVVLSATIDATGKVKSVKVVDGQPAFQQSAIEAVRRWKYKPASLNGQAVDSTAEITLNFAAK